MSTDSSSGSTTDDSPRLRVGATVHYKGDEYVAVPSVKYGSCQECRAVGECNDQDQDHNEWGCLGDCYIILAWPHEHEEFIVRSVAKALTDEHRKENTAADAL